VEETADQFKADVRNLHGQGRKALISLYGGGSTPLTLNTKADIQNFVSSVTSIVQQYGFDGIDLDIENPSLVLNPGDTDFRNPTTPSIVNLIAACRQLRKQFGPGFILTMVPEVVQVQGGFDSYTGTSGSFLPVIYALRDILTFVDAQDYDTPPLPALDGNFYIPGTTDYHVAMTELLLQGFPVGHNPGHFFPPLPPQKVAIGTVASPLMRNFVSTSGLSDALNYLIKGESYGGQYKLQNPAGYPNLLGMMTWNINLDQWSMNYGFSNTIGALLHDLPRTCPPSECPL
jgi:chitinase